MVSNDWNTDFLEHPAFEPLSLFFADIKKLNNWPDLPWFNGLLGNGITNHQSKAISFVGQGGRPQCFEEHYEPRIYLTGEVQTRLQSWHDFFNALVWLRFPSVKKLINKWHYEDAQSQFTQLGTMERTARQNRLAHFDECGVFVFCEDTALLSMLEKHQWDALFYNNREQVINNMHFIVFGHAIYEKMLDPYVGLTAHAILVPQTFPGNASLDDICGQIFKEKISGHGVKLSALPLLGIPTWSTKDQNLSFYHNKSYFR